MYNHILVPTDGSDLAQKGVDHALSLAKALGSKVTIVTATEPFAAGAYSEGWLSNPEDFQRYETERTRSAREMVEKVKTAAEKMGVGAATEHIADRTAATAILETAKRLGCSLIVMSSHGRRGVSRLLLGSQTAEVLAHSPVPVLVVR
ncbi:MAG: universal stress protein [Aliihoeflea sp.]|uniref:universal stress protein n=1 Tax=Aliihoeflea sp. TaxID=2608088 RepID=UPI00403763FC